MLNKPQAPGSARDILSNIIEKDTGHQPVASINPCVHVCAYATWLSLGFIKLENYENNSLTKSLGVVKSPLPTLAAQCLDGKRRWGFSAVAAFGKESREKLPLSAPRGPTLLFHLERKAP